MGVLDNLRSLASSAQRAAPAPARADRVAALAAAAPAPAAGFKTARAGSSYVLNPDGTTVRTKAVTENHPMHQDGGAKSQSSSTYYLTPEAAALAQRAYASGRSPISGAPLNKLVVVDGTPTMMLMQFERSPAAPGSNLPGKPVRELGYKSIPLGTAPAPAVGLSPLEFFGDGGFHLGSDISELLQK